MNTNINKYQDGPDTPSTPNEDVEPDVSSDQ